MIKTKWADLMPPIPWSEYPRPSFVRESYYCLNGQWDFAFCRESEPEKWEKILVPFCPESMLSGINSGHEEGEYLIYRKTFYLPENFVDERVILHFGACDQTCQVLINGIEAGRHEGGYLPFHFDITDFLQEENTITVLAKDDGNTFFPWGKQRKKRGGMWYTNVSGIWQTVWMESVPEKYIENVKFTPTMEGVYVEFSGVDSIRLSFDEEPEKTYDLTSGDFLKVENPRLWTPETPYLYNVTISSEKDSVRTYFALRTVSIGSDDGKEKILLNGKPYFFHGLLDQGYWPDGIYLPPTPAAITEELTRVKYLGFNMVRKHIKVEPEFFYYQCDVIGLAVFQDMVNSQDYSFLHDTAIPTIGFRISDNKSAKGKLQLSCRQFFIHHSEDTVKLLYNHPSIVCWTIFNEGWGQFQSDRLYDLFKEWDKTRIVDSTSGWFMQKKNDVESLHVYFRRIKPKESVRPVVLSEFGGYALSLPGHVYNANKEFGYKKFKDQESLSAAIVRLYREEVLPYKALGLCAAVYTQVSDVEDETNGIFTYDRKVCKVSAEEMRKVAQMLCK